MRRGRRKRRTSLVVVERLLEDDHDLRPESSVGELLGSESLEELDSVVEDDVGVGSHDVLRQGDRGVN